MGSGIVSVFSGFKMAEYLVESLVISGLSFGMLGALAFSQPNNSLLLPISRHLWLLGLFGCAYGAHELLSAWTLVAQAGGTLTAWGDQALLAVAYLALFEFGRRAARSPDVGVINKTRYNTRFAGSAWIYAPILGAILIVAWLTAGLPAGLGAAERYFLGFPGAVLAGVMLHRAFPSGGAWVLVLGGAFAAFGVFGVLIAEESPGLPIWLPTSTWFVAAAGIPVELIRASLAFAAVLALTVLLRRVAAGVSVLPISDAGQLEDLAHLFEQSVYRRTARLQSVNDGHRRAQRIAKIGSWEFTLTSNTLEWSHEVYRIFEVDPKRFEPSYETFLEAVHPDDRAIVNEAYTNSLTAQTPYDLTHRLLMPDGRIKWVHGRCETDFDPDDTPLISSGTVQDVTELKTAELALRESEDRLMRATEMTGLGYFVWDLVENRCVYCSKEYARIHGMTVDEYMRNCASADRDILLVHPDDRERYQQFLDATLVRRERLDLEYRIVTPDGKLRYIREVEGKLEFDGDRAIRSEGTIQDITKIRESEDRLRQAQKMQAVGQLTGGLAHDFNNLLAVIQGNAELLAECAERQLPEIDSILRSTARGSELTQQLLAFSRQQTLKPQNIDLAELVEESYRLFGRTLGADIELEVVAAPDLWPTRADPGQLQTALLNLAINARAAMPDGGKLTIRCSNASFDSVRGAANAGLEPGDYTILEVSDNGVGMSERVRMHAFEPFFTTKDVGQGSGLGLSMVYGFVSQSGGQVSIESELGQGTTVIIFLPRAKGKTLAEETTIAGDSARGQGEVVLVLEDDADVRALAVQMLDNLGYRAIEAADADSAHAVLCNGAEVDVVLSDVVLPGGTSGPEFIAEALETRGGLKAILMSGYTSHATVSANLPGEDVVLLQKPFHKSQLAEALRDAVAGCG